MTRYRDSHDAPFRRFLRMLARTFRIGRLFGVEVRMYWLAAILMPLLFMSWIAPVTDTTVELLLLAGIAFSALFLVIWSHEMGHIVCGRRYGIATERITLSPLGGVAHLSQPAANPRSEIWIALAGPAVHLPWLAVFWPLLELVPWDIARPAAWRNDPLEFTAWFLVETNFWLMLFNLLPFFPMDGGRVLRALLALRLHPNRATMWATGIGIAGGTGLSLYGLAGGALQGSITLVIGIVIVMACLDERRMARHALVYGPAERREAWQSDPDAWRSGSSPFAERKETARRPGLLARFWQRRAERQRQQKERLEREVDRILERVHRHGMAGLSPREKKALERASQRRRGAG